jgi:hypothetical protein
MVGASLVSEKRREQMNQTVEFEVRTVKFSPLRDDLITVSDGGDTESGLLPRFAFIQFRDETEIKLNDLKQSETVHGKECRSKVIEWLSRGRCSLNGEERVDRYGAVTSAEFTRLDEE